MVQTTLLISLIADHGGMAVRYILDAQMSRTSVEYRSKTYCTCCSQG
jgi:hypothetical protein